MQLFSYGLLFFWDDNWSKGESILFVTFAVRRERNIVSILWSRIGSKLTFCLCSYFVTANVWRNCQGLDKARR